MTLSSEEPRSGHSSTDVASLRLSREAERQNHLPQGAGNAFPNVPPRHSAGSWRAW